MDIDFSVEVKHTWIHERPYKVTLTRGASGTYRWEIDVREDDYEMLTVRLAEIDSKLVIMYSALEPTEEEE